MQFFTQQSDLAEHKNTEIKMEVALTSELRHLT